MTLDEFYAEFAKHAPFQAWRLDRGGRLRCKIAEHENCCPLDAMMLANGLKFSDSYGSLSLEPDLTGVIMFAADCSSGHCPEVRKKLLEIAGVSERS